MSPRERTVNRGGILANVALAAVTICTAVGFCRIFPDWAYLRPMLVVALGVHAIALLLRWANVHAALAIPLTAAVGFELLAVAFYRDTLAAFLPSGETVSLLRIDLRLVWEQFPDATAPVPSTGQYVVAVALALGIAALLADAFAFRAFGRAEAVVPTGVLFVFTAALGTERNRVLVAALWLGVSVLAVALLRAAHRNNHGAWLGPPDRRGVARALPAMVVCGALAAVVSGVVAPRLPGAGAAALLDTQNSSGVTEVISPLVDIRSRLVNRSGVQLFTMQSDQPRYWRLTGLPEFDGTTWGLPDEPLRTVDGFFRSARSDETLLDQRLEIDRLGGSLVPSAYQPLAAAGDGLGWSEATGTLVASDGVTDGQVVRLLSVVVDPPADVLRSATVSSPPHASALYVPDDFPGDVRDLAAEVVRQAATPYDQALALQNWFRNNFTYDLNVQSGHSDDAIRSFLRIKRGYCEQFAGTFAAMARSIGLPARVAVGFTPGDLLSDGRYHVYGRNAHAWPEVWFDGIGWVSFEPTPGRGEPGAEDHTGVPPAQDGASPNPTGGTEATTTTISPAPTTTLVETASTIALEDILPAPSLAPPVEGSGGSGGSGGGWTGPLVLLGSAAAVAAWMVLMPALVRRRARRAAVTPSDRVVVAWHNAVGALALAGSRAGDGVTPLEFAGSPDLESRVDHRRVTELARHVTAAIYSAEGADDATATRCEGLSSRIQHAALEVTPWRTRALARLDPRLARMRVAGA